MSKALETDQRWYVEWEYATTIVQFGPFTARDLWRHLKRDAKFLSKSCYDQPLTAITVSDHA